MTKAVFLDRDGIINQKAPPGQYVKSWEDFRILPGVAEGISRLNRAGFKVIVVTNQRGIAKGLMTVADLEGIHKRMSDSLAQAGATIDGIYYCPHEKTPVCRCRKPAPGMLLDAAQEHGIELPASWMIGDSDIDIEAGKNADCKTARVVESSEPISNAGCRPVAASSADIDAPSFLDVIQQILLLEKTASGTLMRGSTARHR